MALLLGSAAAQLLVVPQRALGLLGACREVRQHWLLALGLQGSPLLPRRLQQQHGRALGMLTMGWTLQQQMTLLCLGAPLASSPPAHSRRRHLGGAAVAAAAAAVPMGSWVLLLDPSQLWHQQGMCPAARPPVLVVAAAA